MEPGAGQGALALDVDLLRTCLNQFATRRDDRGQVARAGAVAGGGQVDLLLRQGQQAVSAAEHRPLQALVVRQVRFQLLGMLAGQGFALGLQLVEFGEAGGNRGVLPGAGEQRQVEGELHAHHVAELAPPALVIDLPAPVGFLLRLGLAHFGFRLASNRGEGRQFGVLLQFVGEAGSCDRPHREVAHQGSVRRGAYPTPQPGAGLGVLTGQFILPISQFGRFLLGCDCIRSRCPSPGDLRPHGGG
ncbi:hypothetical protein D9M70_417510 [compost metagenome]